MIEELIFRTLCDTPPATADGVFLFGQTPDNQASVLGQAVHLLQRKTVPRILFAGTAPISGYPGFENWKKELLSQGVDAGCLTPVPPVPPDTEILHTFIEATSVVHLARQHGYSALVVVASPFQQPRAFMAAATAAMRHFPELRLYSVPGKPLPWREEVKHSQGKVTGTRAELIEGELERIQKYHAKGELASVKEVLQYLNARDR